MNNFNNTLLKSIGNFVDNKLQNLYHDKTFPTVIYGKNSDGTYKIPREGSLYNVPNGLPIDLENGQHVWVTVPCGTKNLKDMYISALRK